MIYSMVYKQRQYVDGGFLLVSWLPFGRTITNFPLHWQFSTLLCASNMFHHLLSNDAGNESPNTANTYQLERLNMEAFSSYIDSVGNPYFWVQWICGLNYKPNEDISAPTPNAALSVKHFQNVVLKIKRRVRSRISLQKQVDSLGMSLCTVSRMIGWMTYFCEFFQRSCYKSYFYELFELN